MMTCAKSRHSVTMTLKPRAQWKLLEVCRLNRPRYVNLDGERVVDNDDNSVLASSDR